MRGFVRVAGSFQEPAGAGDDNAPVTAGRGSRTRPAETAFVAAVACGLLGVVGWAARTQPHEVVLARFVTSLQGRTPNQVHNVALAARSVNGKWLHPGQVFSFNRALGPWSSDSGYKRAPVSFDGELVPSWGGGVCQASTTLYNAALLAGLTPVERHRHVWAAHYVAPGRDAAVAYSNIDLRFRNDFTYPIRLEAEVRGELIEFRVVGPQKPDARWELRQRVESVTDPAVVRQPWGEGQAARRVRNPGKKGYRVLTYRVKLARGTEASRELLSDDHYPAMNRLLLTQDTEP